MKQALALLAIFLVAFAATLLLMRDAFAPRAGGTDDPTGPAAPRDVDPAIRRRADVERSIAVKDAESGGAGSAEASTPAATPELGEIEIAGKTDDGLEPAGLEVWCHPAAPAQVPLGGARFRLAALLPGTYHVGAIAPGYLAGPAREVVVHAGRRHAVEVPLERGFELRGMVIEDVEQRPIQGAVIDFNGLARATSDAYGSFTTGIVPKKALDVITVSHDDYERNRVVHPVIPETRNIVLAMSRGRGTVTGRIIVPSAWKVPSTFVVRIWRVSMPGHEELRRERTFRDVTAFEVRGVFGGTHVLDVSFPGSGIASRRMEFDLGTGPAWHGDVDLGQGGTILGTFVSPTNIAAGHRLELLDLGNHVLGEAVTDAEGRFRFDGVAPGDYAIRMAARIPPIHTQSFRVEAAATAQITVDGRTGLLR